MKLKVSYFKFSGVAFKIITKLNFLTFNEDTYIPLKQLNTIRHALLKSQNNQPIGRLHSTTDAVIKDGFLKF